MTSAPRPETRAKSIPRGRVVFVGTGPGDPDLLTLAAVAALSDADTILLERDALRAIFDHPAVKVPANARIESMAQFPTPDERADHIAMIVGVGRQVVRLVDGDPFLDGAIAEEAAACVARGVDFEVVPGVSSLTAVPEYAGIPLDDSQGVAFVSAVDVEITPERARHWTDSSTVVISCRASQAQDLVAASVQAGRPIDDRIVVTCRGGSREQLSKETTLGHVVEALRSMNVSDDEQVHVMLGRGLSYATPELDWFETKPLFGWRVLVPKTKDAIAPLTSRLSSYGAHHEEVPTLSVEPPRTPQQMDKAIRGLVEGRFEWVVFTSPVSVRAVREKFDAYGLDARAFSGLRVAAVSSDTARALHDWGIDADLVPAQGEQTAQGLADAFPAYDEGLDPINRVFIPRADIATEALGAQLTELGWEVEDITAYRTVRAAPPPAETREAIKTGKFDAVVFTSSSTVRNLVGIAGKPHHATVVAAIGPSTAKTCEEHGIRVDVIAARPDLADVVDALASFASQRRDDLRAAGEQVYKPSQRRPGSRRRS